MNFRNARWWIAVLLLVVATKNYVDRQMLPVLAPTIQAELPMTDQQYAWANNLFLIAYTIAFLVSGRLVDALGPRWCMTLFIAVWSAAGAFIGFVRSAVSLGWLRFVFGLGEAGAYTASPKVVSEWFPESERGVANSLYALGGSIGATIAPAITVVLVTHYGWRQSFVIAGTAGFAMVALWLACYRNPGPGAIGTATSVEPAGATNWKGLFRSSTVWAVVVARMMTDSVWYFLLLWFPKYLHTVRGLPQQQLSKIWLIFLAADIGFLGGGYLSDRLIRRGRDARIARLIVMGGCALIAPLAAGVPLTHGIAPVFALCMAVALAHASWMTNICALIMDLVPKSVVGTAFGLVAAGSAAGGIVMNQVVAWTIGRYSYDPCFYAILVLHPIAFLLLWSKARRPLDPRFRTA